MSFGKKSSTPAAPTATFTPIAQPAPAQAAATVTPEAQARRDQVQGASSLLADDETLRKQQTAGIY